ncbi:porin [uncultured Sutterella sp.]|uniref:porin n=1 Tax=uncultured Sutterella sp. TaxID=286133 RepID=UPI00259BF31F|nr:porin [uncultured Sutterella sp.]
MFKKTLAAAAILGAFAGSAFAADVTLYGVIDTGFSYMNTSKDGADDTNTFQMKTGQQAGNRFGLKGTEDLGNGMKVGFVLENGFDADDGTFDSNGDNRIFGREALLFVEGAFGHVGFGRAGQLAGGAGSYALAGSNIHPFSTGWGTVGASTAVFGATAGRFDNMITYKTPTFAGLTVYAQYSFDNNTQTDDVEWNGTEFAKKHGTEGKATVDRYYAIGAQYKVGGFEGVAIVDSINYNSKYYRGGNGSKDGSFDDDALSVTLGAAYNFGVVKAYLNGQYFDNSKTFGKKGLIQYTTVGEVKNADGKVEFKGVEGYGVNLGLDVPAFGGTAKFAVGYGEAEQTEVAAGEDTPELKIYQVAAGYIYPLSKRTSVWAAADYVSGDYNKAAKQADTDVTEFIFGMTHKF